MARTLSILGRAILGRAILGFPGRPPVVANPFPVDLVAYLGQALPDLALFPAVLPQQGAPLVAATFQLIRAGRPLRLAGASGIVADRYQFNVWGADALDVATAAEALRRSLQGYRGLMGTTRIQSISLADERTAWEPPVDNSGEGRMGLMMDFTITRAEAR